MAPAGLIAWRPSKGGARGVKVWLRGDLILIGYTLKCVTIQVGGHINMSQSAEVNGGSA